MAIVQCPACGQEISEKAKKCTHCGEVLIEESVPQKFCTECNKEIPIDARECPFCGCPVAPEKKADAIKAKIQETVKLIKENERYSKIAKVVVACLALIIVFGIFGSNLNADERLAYKNAVEMRSMMKDPDSFKLYDEMFLLKHYDENGSHDYTYTVFKYGGANSYGAITTDEAIFRDDEFLLNYADEADENSSNYAEQLVAKLEVGFWSILGDDETLKMVDIDIDKIKNKMGLE